VFHAALIFLPFAALLVLTPGPATALVVQSAARRRRRHASTAIAGNAVGLTAWAVALMLGVSALVIASEVAFTVLKIGGAIMLIVYGVQAMHRSQAGDSAQTEGPARSAFRIGVLTALTNPKAAVFYVALLPQFVPVGQPLLPATLLLAGIHITLACLWYSLLALVIARGRGTLGRRSVRLQQIAGTAMAGFGLKVLVSQR
jgi:threonine/homoserine/homoserine lactone efflux protein